MTDRFDKFTERARKVLQLAQEEAQRFNHNYIGPEHILLGLTREGEGVAARVLTNLGVELPKVRAAVEFIIGRGDRMVMGEIGLTPRAKKAIELAVDEAKRLNHHYIGTEHLLLGLVREGEGIAAGVLESLGINLEKVRTQTILVLSQSGASQKIKEPQVELVPQLMIELLKEAHNMLVTVMQEKEQALKQKEFERAAELDKREKNLRDSISKLETFWHLQPGFAQRYYTQSEIEIVEEDTLDIEHLLLGIVREGEGIAAGVLEQMGVTMERVRTETIKVLKNDTQR